MRNPSVRGRYVGWGLGARGCWVGTASILEFPLCGGFEAGQIIGEGVNLPVRDVARLPWFALVAGPALVVRPVRRFGVWIDPDAVVSLARARFETERSGEALTTKNLRSAPRGGARAAFVTRTPKTGASGQRDDVHASAPSLECGTDAPRSTTAPSLEAVYRDYATMVWRAVRRYGIDEAAAEDVVQEVFLIVRRRLPDYDGRASLASWLIGIARRVAANHRRGARRRKARLAVVEEEREPTPEDWARKAEAAARLQAFLDGLPRDQREVFALFDIEGLRAREVSAALRIPTERVYSRLRAARAKLRDFLGETDGE